MRRPLASLIALGVRNPVMANLAMVCILAGGYLSVRGMVRETYPVYTIGHIGIDVIYPGASPADVEEGITIKVEQAIKGIPGIFEISSSSSEGRSTVYAVLDNEVDDADRVLKRIQDQVGLITTFPESAEEPVISEWVLRQQVVNIAISGDVSERTLKVLAEQTRDDLLANAGISQVSLLGVRDYEISIEVSEESLRRYGLSFADLIAAIKRGSVDMPAGTLRTADQVLILRTMGQRHTGAEFEELVVISAPDGTLVRLGQIATVRDAFEESPKRGWFDERPASMVVVYKTQGQDTSTIARLAEDYVDKRQASLPPNVSMQIWADNSRDVDGRISMLVGNGVAGMVLVLVALTLFLNTRLSFWVAAGVPVSYAGALIILGATDQTLNMISLVGLIMATGIIVDDAIVIAENIHTHRRSGEQPTLAAINGTAEMALPVLGSSATTIVAFAPLLYVSGIMGKFIHVLPVVVIAAIVASAFEAFFILPAHLRRANPRATRGRRARLRRRLDTALDRFVEHTYRPLLIQALHRRAVTLSVAAGALLLAVGLVAGGRIPFVMFPKGETTLLRARVRFPEGSPASVSEAAIRQIERAALAMNVEDAGGTKGRPVVQHRFSNIGGWGGFWRESGSHLGEVRIELSPAEHRSITAVEALNVWRRAIGTVHDALSVELTTIEMAPTEKPLEIRLHGRDLDQLALAGEQVRERLAGYAGVSEVQVDLIPGKLEMQVSLKPLARTLGLAEADLALQLREGFHGGEAVRLLRDGAEVKVQVRYPEEQRRSLADVEGMRVRTLSGEEIPFREAASVKMVRGYSTIWRQDGRRRVRIQANVDERLANTEDILAEMSAGFLPELEQRLAAQAPEAELTFSLGGQWAQMRESMGSLKTGYLMAMVAIYAILASMMGSYIQPVIITATIPLGIVGVVAGHMIMGYNLTLLSVFGAVALSGVVVNDALVLIVQINRKVRAGTGVFEAIVQGGASRFRAVILTTVTTVAGLVPLLFERSTQAAQLIPMVISLAFGLAVATLMTLLVVPALYLVVNDLRRLVYWLYVGGPFPTAEAVERLAVESSEPAVAR